MCLKIVFLTLLKRFETRRHGGTKTLRKDFRKKVFSSPCLPVLVPLCLKIVFLTLLKAFETRRHKDTKKRFWKEGVFFSVPPCLSAFVANYFKIINWIMMCNSHRPNILQHLSKGVLWTKY